MSGGRSARGSSLGHSVRIGARDARNEKALAWAREAGTNASAGTFADAASFGDIVVLATLGVANESAISMAGPDKFAGKVMIDTTNPLDFSGGMPPKLAVSGNDSGDEPVNDFSRTATWLRHLTLWATHSGATGIRRSSY